MAQLSFDVGSAPKREPRNFDPLPAGKYLAMAVDSSVIATRSNGEAVKFQFQIIQDGPFKDRRVFTNINIKNNSPKAEKIGREELREFCEAVGFGGVLTETSLLHNKKVTIRLKVRIDDSGKYEPQNEVVGYYPAEAVAATGGVPAFKPAAGSAPPVFQAPAPAPVAAAPASAPAAAPTPAPAAASKPVWAKTAA